MADDFDYPSGPRSSSASCFLVTTLTIHLLPRCWSDPSDQDIQIKPRR